MSFYSDTKKEILNEIGGEDQLEKYKYIHPSKLKLSLWIWLHPSSYKLIHWGMPGCALFQALLFKIISLYFDKWYINMMFWFSLIIGIILLIVQYKGWTYRKGLTMYEIHLEKSK